MIASQSYHRYISPEKVPYCQKLQVKAKNTTQEWFSARANLFSIEVENDTKTGLFSKTRNSAKK